MTLSSAAPISAASSGEVYGKVLSARRASALKLRTPCMNCGRYSFAAARIDVRFFSATHARSIVTIPNTWLAASSAMSRSQLSSCGSIYIVDCALYISKFPARLTRDFSSFMSSPSK